jgi:Tfp pilus assembly major pilin PilA
MKKIIKWLADVSGVTNEIKSNHAKYIGSHMRQYSYWFSGGLMHDNPLKDVANILSLYPDACLKHGQSHLFGSQHMELRSKLYKMNQNNESVFCEKA